MTNRTIKRMKLADLRNLLEETVNKINEIDDAHKEISKIRDSVLKAETKIENIDEMITEVGERSQEVLDFHGEVFSGDEDLDEESIKDQMNSLMDSWKESNDELEELKEKIFGHTEKDEDGEDQQIPGYIEKIKERLNNHEKKYKDLYDRTEKELNNYETKHEDLYDRIETELSSGATTVSLTRHFNVKVKEYHKARRLWEGARVFLLVLGLVGFTIFATFFTPLENLQDWLLSLLRYIPVFSIFIWLVVLMGNRCAENHKLEESYKHKEVMAQSFTGYRESIKEISDHDDKLLNKLMEDLLNAIKHDSSAFLSAKGEKHPIVEAAGDLKNK